MKTKIHAFFLCAMTALFAAAASWAEEVSLTSDGNGGFFVNLPVRGEYTLAIPSNRTTFKVYDDGQDANNPGYYSNTANAYLEMTAPEGFLLQVTGSIHTQYNDVLTIYDGPADSKVLVDAIYGEMDVGPVLSGRVMTIYFYSNYSLTDAGLDLTVTLVPAPEHDIEVGTAPGGNVVSTPASATYGTEVALVATPDQGFLLDNVIVMDGEQNYLETSGGWYTNNTVTFSMPNTFVTATPSFTEALTAEDGLFINMPVSGTTVATIPDGVASFKIYDNGGENGYYTTGTGELELTVPEGYVLQVTGYTDVYSDYYGWLTFFDGNTEAATLKTVSGSKDIGTVVGTGRTMTLRFLTWSANASGLNLTATLMDASVPHAVSLADGIAGGTMEGAGNYTAGSVVTLSLIPDENYVYSSVQIVDEYGNNIEGTIATTGNETTVSFTMPYGDVTVTPTFITPHAVTIESAQFGHVTSDKQTAFVDERVNLTAVPDEGAQLVRVDVVETEGGQSVYAYSNGTNGYYFTMPDKPVTVTPVFANPSTVTFDENGCLTNGTYFHLNCSSWWCSISQEAVTSPNEGTNDFKCWGDLVDEFSNSYPTYSVRLATNLDFGGYDETNNKCKMANFTPIQFSNTNAEFDGRSEYYTISGFCYEDNDGSGDNSMGFMKGVKTVRNVTFDNAHVVVKNAELGSVVGIVTDDIARESSTFSNVRVTNSYVAGTQAGAFAGKVSGYENHTIQNSGVVDTKVYGLDAANQGVMTSAAGSFVGYANGITHLAFVEDTVMVTTAGAGLVADDASYTGSGNSYRGGFIGYQTSINDPNYLVNVRQSLVSGLSVGGTHGTPYVGALAGDVQWLIVMNSNLENITVSGAYAGGLAGSVGDNDYGDWHVEGATLSGSNSVTGTVVAGGLLGYGHFSSGGSEGDKSVEFRDLLVDVNVSGGSVVGGLAGRVTNTNYGSVTPIATNIVFNGNVTGSVASMTSEAKVGGLFGDVVLDNSSGNGSLSINKVAFNGNVSFTNSGTQNTLNMGPFFGFVDGAILTIYGSYSNGDITYSGVDATNANVGYLGGYFVSNGSNAHVYANYHFGTDAVATGIGNVSEADWKTGSDAYFANVRNLVTGLTDDGKIGYHYYELSGGPVEASYTDFFAADLSGNTFGRVANGVVNESEMKSAMFAAAMNQVTVWNASVYVWTQSGNALPSIATPADKSNYLLPLVVADAASLLQEQQEAFGLNAVYQSIDMSGNAPTVNEEYKGFVGYTDASGHANKMFVDSLQAVMRAFEAKGLSPYLSGEGAPDVITANTVFTDGVENIGVMTNRTVKTYDVVYQYCDQTCDNIEDLTTKNFVFMSPKVTEVSNNEAAYTTLVPYAVALSDPSDNLLMRVLYLDDSDDPILPEPVSIDGFATFSELIGMVSGEDAVTKIVVQYNSGSAPSVIVKNPAGVGFTISTYAYDGAGDKTPLSTVPVSVGQSSTAIPYAAAFAASGFTAPVGYEYADSYSISFMVSNPNDNRCQNIASVGTIESESKDVAPWEELSLGLNECTSKTWVVGGLTSEDTVGMENVKMARSLRKTEIGNGTWADTFAVIPNYVAKPYNVVFHFDGQLELYGSKYPLFVADNYNDPTNPQGLDDENRNFPTFFGRNIDGRSVMLAGWTIDESRANCVIFDDDCYENNNDLFFSLVPELITAAGDAETIDLYPVWETGSYSSTQAVYVSSCLFYGSDDTDCYAFPINITVKQNSTIGGNPIVLSTDSRTYENWWTADGYVWKHGVRIYQYAENSYTFDVEFRQAPGFKVDLSSVRAPGYDASTGKVTVVNGNVGFLVDYTVLNYNVDLSLENVKNDVFLGRSWESSREMSVHKDKYQFPNVYVREEGTTAYGTPYWGVKTAEGYEGHSKVFDSELAGQFLADGYEYYTPAVNDEENASVTVYAVEIIESASSSTYSSTPLELNVIAVDNNDEALTDESDYHGSLVLTQTYDNDEKNVHLSFEHATWFDNDRHMLYIPNNNDTLSFTVSARPDPGYRMFIDPDFTYTQKTGAGSVDLTEAGSINWGYNNANDSLIVQPKAMDDLTFHVLYEELEYNVTYVRPTPESKVIVANKFVDNAYQTDWFENPGRVSASNAHERAPRLYNEEGCRIGWKLEGREVDTQRETADVTSELNHMSPFDGEVGLVNMLEPDWEHPVCDEGHGYFTVTLNVEGSGNVYLVQKIGDVPVSADDPEQTIITHSFVSKGEGQPMELHLPRVLDDYEENVGSKYYLVVEPAEGYLLKSLSYDMMVNGQSVTILAQDGAELDVFGNIPMRVTFEQYKPVYVTYDLVLGEEDSSKVWIPADAVPSGSLQIGADGSAAPMWTPFRTDKCFAGWSMYDPNGPQPEVDPIYTEVSTWNVNEFSSDMASPTKLYATWMEYGNGCNQPTTARLYIDSYYEGEEEHYMTNGDTIIVSQKFGNAVFTHKAWLDDGSTYGDELVFAHNSQGYDVSFTYLPGFGVELDENNPNAIVANAAAITEPLVAEDGWFHLDAAQNANAFYVGFKENKIPYDIVFAANAEGETVAYGASWSATRTMRIGGTLPMGSVYRSDACFVGWSFSPNASAHVEELSLTAGMLKDRADRIAAGLNADTLFARWNGYSDCRTGTLALTLDASIQNLATVVFYQNLDGIEQKAFEMTGSDEVYLPSGPTPYEEGSTSRVDDDIFFSRVEVIPKVGVTLANEYQAFYVNESDETTENPLPMVAGNSEVEFGENAVIRVQGLSKVDYSVVYHENAGDTAVFYGENWGATATLNVGRPMTTSIYRTDKCLAGWKLDDNGLVYDVADADFIAEIEEREIEGDIDLYAVWSADAAGCANPIQNVTVSLSDDLKNKATVELMQTVDGESKVVATVGAEGVSIPKVTTREEAINGGTEVVGEFAYFSGLRVVPAPGYALDQTVAPSYTVGDAEAVEVSAEPLPWTMTANTVISGAVNAVEYTVAFDVNAGSANVFYPADWPENALEVSYDLGMDESARLFPKVYRTDKCLVGYGFSKDASKAESFATFDSNFVKAAIAAGVESPVLYAVWNECETPQTLYTVTLNEPVEGTLVLSQHGNSYEVPSNGFNVPAAPLGIVFAVSFNVNEGYEFDENGTFTVDDGSGEFAALEDNLLVVDGNKIVDAPAAGKPYTFAFDVNVEEGENVFYGADWKESDNYALATEDIPFPKGVYRVGACLAGWTIGKETSTAYTQYNATFVAAVENANKAGMPVSTLYAKWGDCETTQTVATVANADALAGTFTLSRTVSNTTVEYTVGETALQVPADEALDFTVSFAANKGYIYNSMNGISAVDASNATVEINEGVLNVAASLTLSAAVSPSTYIFVFKENAGDANVFYMGTPVENITVQITDDADARAFPMNLYRADACLVGWSFSETATTGFTEFDGDVVAAFDAANSGDLYAVWDAGCQQKLLTVYSADSGKGVLTLSQGNRSFVVGDDGLQVPETDDGIAFAVSFVPATGYAYDDTKGFASFDPQGIPLGELENGSVTVKHAMSIAALGLAESEYVITFNMNAGDAKVYYGNPLEGANPKYTYTLADSAAFPMDFYRTDACIKGWTLLATPAETDRRFTKFDAEFAASVEAAGSDYTGALYADWGTCATTSNVTVAQAASEMGTLTLVQRDADDEIVNSTEVKDEAVTLPLGKGDISFAVEFTPNPGFSKIANSYFYTVDANGNNLAALVNDRLTLAGNTIVKAPAKADAFAVAFDANAATGVNVFYGSGWNASGSYDISMSESERTFPTEIYRVGYKLVGWSLTKIADGAAVYYTSEGGPSGYENTYQKYDEKSSEVLQANGSSTVTMYAVWVPDAGQSTYAVALSNPNAGSLTLSQDVPGAQDFEVGSDELLVPFVQGGLVFHVSATLNSGYFANGSSLNLVDSDGNVLGSLQNGTLVVDEDKTLEIPVEADGVQFVFVENTKAHVFYENGWNNKGFFALEGETAFPTGLLRTDARLQGWAISRSSSKHYLDYNTQFVEDLRNYRSLGITVDTLYAVWDEYATIETEIVKSEGDRTGSFFISQTVNDVTTEPIEVTASGVEIPRSSKGITFNVNYEVKPGYRIASESAITKSDISGEVLGSTTNGGTLVFGQEQSLALDASVSAVPYKFAYNVNGGDANVFYGDNWSSTDDKTLDDESVALPNNIYRADAKLVGWSVDSNATEGSFDLTSEFVREMGDASEVRTLYAVWMPAEVETYTVSFANTNVGSLVLTQDVEDSTVSFAVADTGLVVPVVEGGLRFKAAYTLKAGFSGSTDSLYVLDDLTGFLTSLTDGNLTVAEDVTLAIPTEGETFNVVFHVNREKEVLFYGNDWKEKASYKLDDSTVSIPLPAYLYTANACMVGWSLDRAGEGTAYTEFTSDFADILLSDGKKDMYNLYAVWGTGKECESAYDRVALESVNGSIRLVEPAEDSKPAVEHIFAVDNTIILPKVMNGNMLRVVSVPDSSFMLDSLVVLRDGSDDRQMLRDGDALPFSLHGASLVAFFGKSNRTDIEFVKPELALSGNAVQFSFTTSEFEVTRNVSARIVLRMEGVSEPVVDTVFADSIVPPYSGAWQMFPLAAGKYVLTAELFDAKGSVDTTAFFEVKAEIAAVAEDGWQMISLVNLDKKAMDWSDDDARFYWWDESTSMGDFWQYRAFSPDDEIEPTRGYWYSSIKGRPLVLKPTADVVLEGAVWNLDSINSGWNLVANPYGFSLNIYGENPHANRDPSEKSDVTFWRWNAEISDYEEAVVIKPYEAVWAEVRHSMDWKLPVEPEFADKDSSEQDSLAPALSKRILAKAANSKNWTLQAVLSDLRGKKDAWNIFGASTSPFVTNEPPEGMGDRVNLSIVEGNRKLAKSVKAPADELEWDVELSATSDRVGELSFKGVESLREVGLKVFVTVDGKTTEMHEGETLRVNLTSFAKKATVRVAPAAKVVASFSIDALRYVKSGANVGVTFEASEGLAGSRTVVDILGMDGKVVSSRSATTLAGVNQLVLDAPKPGLYMLRVRAGSQMKAGRIMVK